MVSQDFAEPPVPPGHTRVYEDHTGRWWTDFPNEKIEEMKRDPLMMMLNEAITEEINREIVEMLRGLGPPLKPGQ